MTHMKKKNKVGGGRGCLEDLGGPLIACMVRRCFIKSHGNGIVLIIGLLPLFMNHILL